MDQKLIDKALTRAVNGGTSGFLAMTGQVCSMMWIRTIINYQYRHGGGFLATGRILYAEGKIPRFYRGIQFALLQAPLSRFGDTAMNMGAMTLLENSDMSIAEKTFIGSTGAGLWRASINPIDTLKSSLQVNGKEGVQLIKDKVRMNGIGVLYNGGAAAMVSTMAGHFPWFFTYNYLDNRYPRENYAGMDMVLRSAGIGFLSSGASDISSNIFRIVKVNKQTQLMETSYLAIFKTIIAKEGVIGGFTRGLKTKLISNGIQGMVFTVLFDYFRG